MGAFDTLPSHDPEAMADLAAAALEHDPDDWRLAHVAAHLLEQHPQVAAARTWPDDNLYAAHEADHRDWNHDHTHPALARASKFAELNPDFPMPLRPGDPYRHRLAHAWEVELAVGQRVERAQDKENLGATAHRTSAVTDRAHTAEAERFADLNPAFGVLPDQQDPQQHEFAADREQALALGTRVAEGLRAHNHPAPERRQRAIDDVAVQAKLCPADYGYPTRKGSGRGAEHTGARPVAQRPAPGRTRGGPARPGAER